MLCPTWLGDTVMATPFFRALRTAPAFRGARVSAALRTTFHPLLAGIDAVDDLLAIARTRTPAGLIHDARRLREQHADALIVLPNSFRSGVLARLSNAPVRIGYRRDGRGPLLTHALECPMSGGWKQPISAIDYYLAIARRLGAASEGAPDERLPRLAVTAAEKEAAEALLHATGTPEDRPLVLLNPGASKVEKRWPADRYAAVGQRLIDDCGATILINGSPDEQALTTSIADAIRGPAGAVVDLPRHQSTLSTLKALCARCRLIVTNDTGTRHLAIGVAAGADAGRLGVITVFGPTAPAWSRTPYEREIELCDERRATVDAVSVDMVMDAAKRLW